MPADSPLNSPTTRRAFIRRGTLATLAIPAGIATLESCVPAKPAAARAASAAPAASAGHEAPAPPPSAETRAEEMDAMHEAGVKAFPARTEGKGNQLLAPRMDRGVKVYDLTCSEVQWEIAPGKRMKAWVYNDQLPGPQIRVREGDRVRINVTNRLPESTCVHFHGLEVPNDQDGVPFITQKPIKPGASHSYEFTVPNSGSHMYHSHHNAAKQVGMGLLGAFIVDPRDPNADPKVDVDAVMILNDMAHGYTLNGKGFPATEPIVAKRGQTLRIRFMNEGMQIHPMHLHGMHMTVIAKDGWNQPAPWKCDTLNIAPGERWDVLVKASNPGTWAFHCHILTHAESEHGMFGMVTALIVE
jgi:FtsP/CotA-like multicopper oxidase with cupredoxin domain